MRWSPLIFLLAGCTLSPTCPAGDFRCLFTSFSVAASERGAKLPLTRVNGLVAADAGTLRIGAPERFDLEPNGGTLLLAFQSPLQCQPAYCFSVCAVGAGPCASDAVCIPPVQVAVTGGLTSHWLELGAQPVGNTGFDLVVTPVAAPGCPLDVATRLVDGEASVVVGVPAVVATIALRRPKGPPDAGQTCLQASTLLCTDSRFGGSRSRCITRTEYEEATGLPLPAAPAPDGTFGCYDEAGGVLVKPCLPTSTCRVGFQCGGGTVPGGVCNP